VLYDITPAITPNLAVWPGDTPPNREVLLDMTRGDNITSRRCARLFISARMRMDRITMAKTLRQFTSARSIIISGLVR